MLKDRDLVIKFLEDAKAVWVKVVGQGMDLTIQDKPTEETVNDFINLYDSLGNGAYVVHYRANKNDSKGGQSLKFQISGSVVSGHAVSGLESIGGPSQWQTMQENQELKDKIRQMEFDFKMKEMERKTEEKIRALQDKEGSGGLEKIAGIFGQFNSILDKAKLLSSSPGKVSDTPVSAPAANLAGLPNSEGQPAGETEETDPSEEVGNHLAQVASAMGEEAFIEVVRKMGESAKENPEEFARKIESMKAFL